MKRRSYNLPAIDYARAALAVGPLILIRQGACNALHYRFGRRLFNAKTVATLVALGEAVRDGNQIVRAA